MQNNLGFFSFIPTYGNIRIVVTGSNRFALTNLHLDRDYVDMQIETYDSNFAKKNKSGMYLIVKEIHSNETMNIVTSS